MLCGVDSCLIELATRMHSLSAEHRLKFVLDPQLVFEPMVANDLKGSRDAGSGELARAFVWRQFGAAYFHEPWDFRVRQNVYVASALWRTYHGMVLGKASNIALWAH